MRATETTRFLSVYQGIQRGLERQAEAGERLSSGRRINRLSDAPGDAATAMRLKASESDLLSFAKASDDGTAWLHTQDNALQTVSERLIRVRELVVAAGNSTNTPAANAGIAIEIESIRDEIANHANTTYGGKAVFAGFADQAVTGGPGAWAFTATGDSVDRRIDPQTVISVNTDANQVFGNYGGATGPDLFSLLDRVAANVRAGNVNAVTTTDLQHLDARMGDVGAALGSVGSRTRQIESVRGVSDLRVEDVRRAHSDIVDVDLARAAMDLAMAESGYQAALAAAARLQMPSLVDFLR